MSRTTLGGYVQISQLFNFVYQGVIYICLCAAGCERLVERCRLPRGWTQFWVEMLCWVRWLVFNCVLMVCNLHTHRFGHILIIRTIVRFRFLTVKFLNLRFLTVKFINFRFLTAHPSPLTHRCGHSYSNKPSYDSLKWKHLPWSSFISHHHSLRRCVLVPYFSARPVEGACHAHSLCQSASKLWYPRLPCTSSPLLVPYGACHA